MTLRSDVEGYEWEIADLMVAALEGDPELAIPEVHIAAPLELQRERDKMTPDHIYIDVVPIGVVAGKKNVSQDEYEFEHHIVVRSVPADDLDLTREWVSVRGWYRQRAGERFNSGGNYKRLVLPSGPTAHRSLTQPFVLFSRDGLYQNAGLFVTPIQINWKMLAP